MKRLIIIVEGATEQAFCERALEPFFNLKDIYLYPTLIKESKGGIVHRSNIKKEIEESHRRRFVSDLQLYEFEGLLFSVVDVLRNL